MKHILFTTIAAVVLVGCGESQPTEPQTAKAPDISIHDAANEGNIEGVKQHSAAGMDVDVKDESGETPLHFADNKEIADLLITSGADVNARDVNGYTPLDWAIFNKDTKTVDLLRKHGGKTGEGLKAEGE